MHEFIIVLTSFDTQSSLTKASEDNSTITAAIIAVAGVIIGAILTLLAQLLLNSIENKRDKKKQLYEKQMEIYPLALEYIIFYAQLQIKIRERVNANTITNMVELEKEKFLKFYYTFSIISSAIAIECQKVAIDMRSKNSQIIFCSFLDTFSLLGFYER